MEKEDIDSIVDSFSNIHSEDFDPILLMTRSEMMKRFDNPSPLENLTQNTLFVVEKKDKVKIGIARHFIVQPLGAMEIGYIIIPSERMKGYGTEAAQILVDYLFLSRNIVRIQATAETQNTPSQRVLENAGFKREGTLRKAGFIRGKWADGYLYSIIREDWKEPKILKQPR
jgi:RimJ/RimL family protein N-acetyltransferase